ncbi:MAG: hypothetical protein KY428_00060 [Bacteroidetes bacterium]|nr:hypothetical protein [Bacteroidota bacterium]
MRYYTYMGDKLTDPALKGKTCTAVERPDGRCIRSKKGTMLVEFAGDRKANVIGRLLKNCKQACCASLSYTT